MNPKHTLAIFLCIAVVLLSLHYVSAELVVTTYSTKTDFTLQTPQQGLSVCSCQNFTDTLTIYNTGAKGDWYKIESTLNLVTVSEPVVFVAAGGSKTVSLAVAADCSAKLHKQYAIVVTAYSGQQKSLPKSISVDVCTTLKTALVVPNGSMDPCQKAQFHLWVQNIGPYVDEFSYSVKSDVLQSLVSNVSQRYVLQPGAVREINFSIVPECSVYGAVPFVVEVTSASTGITSRMKSSLMINQNYQFGVAFAPTVDICKEYAYGFPLTVHNEVAAPNDYALSLSGPSFMKLSSSSLHLEGEERKEVMVDFASGAKLGVYPVTLKATSAVGEAEVEVASQIHVVTCNALVFSAEVTRDQTCDDSKEYIVTVKNTADIARTVVLSVSHPAFMSLDEDAVMLKPGEKRDVVVTVTNPHDDKEYAMVVSGAVEGAVFSQTLKFKSPSKFTCYRVEFAPKALQIHYQDQEKLLTLQHTGIVLGTYEVSVEAPSWLHMSEDTLALSPGESKQVALSIDDHAGIPQGVYLVNVSFSLEDSDVVYTDHVLVTLKDKSVVVKFVERGYAFFSAKACRTSFFLSSCVLVMMIILLIILKLTTPKYPYSLKNKVKQKRGLLLILLGVFVVMVVLVFLIAGVPSVPSPWTYVEPTTDVNVLQWPEDTSYVYDLAPYIQDPDQSLVSIEASTLQHMTAAVKNFSVTFTPEKNWYGEEQVYFIAQDLLGEEVASETLTLRVVDVPEYTLYNYLDFFCWIFTLIVFFLILVVYFFMHVFDNRRPKRKR